jgi:hypothetical protein
MRSTTLQAAIAAVLTAAVAVSCKSIPSLNEPPVYSTYAAVRKEASGELPVEAFVLHRAGGFANDDKYEYLVERETDASGASSLILILRYTGNAPESIERISLQVDGRYLGLGEAAVTHGYSGRFRLEVVEAAMGAECMAAIAAGTKLVVQYYGKYQTFPIEVPEPGLEKLKAFLGR